MQAKPLLRGVVLLMLPGLCRSLFAKRQELLPGMAALLGKPAVVTAPSATIHPGAWHVILDLSPSFANCPFLELSLACTSDPMRRIQFKLLTKMTQLSAHATVNLCETVCRTSCRLLRAH